MRIEILESALDDLQLGRAFYESQKQGLGDYFLDSLFSDIESLTLFAGVHAIFYDRYHRLLSKRFPFAIYYQVEGEIIHIHAILDCRQDAETGTQRLK